MLKGRAKHSEFYETGEEVHSWEETSLACTRGKGQAQVLVGNGRDK